jgi:hypothetical protein
MPGVLHQRQVSNFWQVNEPLFSKGGEGHGLTSCKQYWEGGFSSPWRVRNALLPFGALGQSTLHH